MKNAFILYAFIPVELYFINGIAYNSSFVLMYLSLREESIEPKEKPKKEVKVKGDLIQEKIIKLPALT